jgi:RNA polymerase sigma-70 factor (ECF subfamily)
MLTAMGPTSSESETLHLVERAAGGDQQAWAELLDAYRARLRRMVALRLDPRLRGRVDPSDVIQEACLDAARRLPEYCNEPAVSFYLWLRYLVGQQVLVQHRRHLGVAARDAGREVPLRGGPMPQASTDAPAAELLDKLTSPSQAALRAERKVRLQEALDAMNPLDREIVILRNYEQLTNGEAAQVLGLDKSAASKRYIRALIHLKEILTAMDRGGSEGGSR